MNGAFPPAANWLCSALCQTRCYDQGQNHGMNKAISLILQNVFTCNWKTGTITYLFIPIQSLKSHNWSLQICAGWLLIFFFPFWHEYLLVRHATCPYWFLSSTLRFLCCRGMLWITIRSFRSCWVPAAPTGTLPVYGMVRDEGWQMLTVTKTKREDGTKDKQNGRKGKLDTALWRLVATWLVISICANAIQNIGKEILLLMQWCKESYATNQKQHLRTCKMQQIKK